MWNPLVRRPDLAQHSASASRTRLRAALAPSLALALPCCAAATGALHAQSAAVTTAAEPPRVLFLTHTAGFEHEVVRRPSPAELSYAEALLPRILGPAWVVDSTKDCARINPSELADTQVLVLHTTGELPISDANRRALFDWIEGGGGFVGLHCATDTLYQCAEYMQLVGAAFDGHPWHQAVRVRAFDEPPVAFLRGATFSIFDEIYQFRAQPTGVRVCLELEMSSVDASRGKHASNAIAWWKPVGKGRMVYDALGHGREAWDAPVFHDLVREHVRFAAGPRARPCVDGALANAARDAFFALAALSRADDGKLWGATLDGPVLVVDPATRVAVANRRDAQSALRELVPGLWTATLPAELQLANTALEWSGTLWSMLLAPLPEDARERDVLVVHESYHRLQKQNELVYESAPCAHLDERSGRAWMRLEMRALARALELAAADASSVGAAFRGAQARAALRDALLFRAVRRNLFASATATENALELNEGLAEATGLLLAHADAATRCASAAGALRARDGGEALVRGFAYATGPAYALALDALAPSREEAVASTWRGRALAGESLGKLAFEALALRVGPEFPDGAAERALLAEERRAAYGWPEIDAQEQARDAARRGRVAADRARYVEGERVVLHASAKNSYSFDPNRVRPLAGSGTVYEPVSVSDEWGVLDAPGGALQDEQARWIVPAPTAAPDGASRRRDGPGWELQLAEGWVLERDAGARAWKAVRAR